MAALHPDKISQLAEKWLNGTITPEEAVEFARWYNESQDTPFILPADFVRNAATLEKRLLKSIQHQKNSTVSIVPLYKRKWARYAAIIIVLAVVTGTGYWWPLWLPGKKAGNTLAAGFKNDVAPGGNKAMLVLGDGSTIALDSARNGTLTQQGNSKVMKLAAGQLAYRNISNGEAQTDWMYNSVTTPRGGQYQVILPDGTKVWLNAASSLRFPTWFTGNERRVELTGEAYLEVAKNETMPFTVMVGSMEIEVLGTHFNVMAYEDEPVITTTLLEGMVKVTKDDAVSILKPGQQATLNNKGMFAVMAADVEEAVAWKNGLLQYNMAPIEKIMRQVARWYDVDVVFDGNLANKDFACVVSRQANVSQLLQLLELTGTVHFTIEGKRITVKP